MRFEWIKAGTVIRVKLDGKITGTIRQTYRERIDGLWWQYTPKGGGAGSNFFSSLEDCKRDVAGDDYVAEPMRRSIRPDITLSTGTVVEHEYAANGSQNAFVKGDRQRAMTDAEWSEYRQRLTALGELKAEFRKRKQLAEKDGE